MKGISFLLLACMSILVLSGCWDRVEVNDLAIVTGAAIDKKDDNQIELTIQMFIPKRISSGSGQGAGSGGEKVTETISHIGRNLPDAISKLQEGIPRQIFWGQCRVFIFGKKLAEAGIQEQLDFLLRNPGPRERAYVYVSEVEPKTILEISPNIERFSAEVLREITNNRIGMRTTLQDVEEKLSGVSRAAALPYVKIKTEQLSEGNPLKYIHINGTAVFNKDKMIGTLTEAETRGVLWLRDEIKGYTVSVEIEDEEGLVSINSVSTHVRLTPQIIDGKWRMGVDVVTEGDIVSNETHVDFENPKLLKKVESAYQESIENRIRETLQKLQHEMHTDIVGFSKEFHWKYPKEWKGVENHWDELFSEVDVTINVDAQIRREGQITKPGALPRDEVKEK